MVSMTTISVSLCSLPFSNKTTRLASNGASKGHGIAKSFYNRDVESSSLGDRSCDTLLDYISPMDLLVLLNADIHGSEEKKNERHVGGILRLDLNVSR